MGTIGRTILGIVVVAVAWIAMQMWIGWDATRKQKDDSSQQKDNETQE